jgi:membrane dipeptidase
VVLGPGARAAGIDDVVAHLDHAREVAGIRHIGLGIGVL